MHRTGRGIMVGGASVAGALLLLQLVHVLSRNTAAYVATAFFLVGSSLPLVWRRVRAGAAPSENPAPNWLDVSEDLVEFVQSRSNVLYVWGDEVGGGFAVLRASLERPAGIQFDEVLQEPFRLRLATDIRPPELRLRYRSWPHERILVDAGQFAGDGGGAIDGG